MREFPLTEGNGGMLGGFAKDAWDSYLTRRGTPGQLDTQIAGCRDNPNSCSDLMRQWVGVIDVVNMLPPDKTMRADIMNRLVDKLVTYDDDKGSLLGVVDSLVGSGGRGWIQTPQETLSANGGKGACADVAVLKMETALRTGFSPDDVRVVLGSVPGLAYHVVTTVNTGDKKHVLDGSMPLDNLQTVSQPLIPDSQYVSGYKAAFHTSSGGAMHISEPVGTFKPVMSFGDNGVNIFSGTPASLPEDVIPVRAYHFDDDLQARMQKRLAAAVGQPETASDAPPKEQESKIRIAPPSTKGAAAIAP